MPLKKLLRSQAKSTHSKKFTLLVKVHHGTTRTFTENCKQWVSYNLKNREPWTITKKLMNSLFLAAGVAALYIIAYHTYGKFLGRKIFKLNPEAVCPSREFQDNVDFVPSRKQILFGHHFTSIAGTGPIVGPAIAIIWGWVPALIWWSGPCLDRLINCWQGWHFGFKKPQWKRAVCFRKLNIT